jgi:hypothetical protein
MPKIISFSAFLEATQEQIDKTAAKPKVAPISTPLGDMTLAEHKKQNAEHPFWKGHPPSWNSERKVWEPHSHNIFGGEETYHKDASGKILRDESGNRMVDKSPRNAVSLKHVQIGTDRETGNPAYAVTHQIGDLRGKPIHFGYSSHFMSRLNDYDETGHQLQEAGVQRPNISPIKMRKSLVEAHKQIGNLGVMPHKGLYIKSDSNKMIIPCNYREIDGEHYIIANSVLPIHKDMGERKRILIESYGDVWIYC